MSSREENCFALLTELDWVRRNPEEEGETLLSLTAADLAQLGEAFGESGVSSRV